MEPSDIALARVKQVFRFLKDLAERRLPHKRRMQEHHWSRWLRDLPEYPTIQIGQVLMASASDSPDTTAADPALISVKRPKLTEPPTPPERLLNFLETGWRDPDQGIRVLESRNVVRDGMTVTERFDADEERVRSLAEWKGRWVTWAVAERPARRAMRTFEDFYELKGRIERESERVELVLGDGRLSWQNQAGPVDHPVLLQRVELLFDPLVPEFRVVDADRGPELLGQLLLGGESFAPAQLNTLYADLEQQGFHPLAKDGTEAYLRRIAQLLAPNGVFEPQRVSRSPSPQPCISRDSVLFLRDRPSGFPEAFERALVDMERRGTVPTSLSRLVGVETELPGTAAAVAWSPWGEPPEILLSKPANEEQVHIARALDRHQAVIVQGPPGTGKSHTIANLIGHLVAHGKRVLVTSHTTKALRVLRGHVVDALKPLCVALLDNDLEGRTQMEEAVKAILSRLTVSSPDILGREVASLSEQRSQLNKTIATVASELRAIRQDEYAPIAFAGETISPAEAARWSVEHAAAHGWIPGPVEAGSPIPVDDDSIRELYESNVAVTPAEEEEIRGVLVPRERLPDVAIASALFEAWASSVPSTYDRFWSRGPIEADLAQVETLETALSEFTTQHTAFAPWQKVVVEAGYNGVSDSALWNDLARLIHDCAERFAGAKRHFLELAPELAAGVDASDARRLAREIGLHVQGGGSLGSLALLFKPAWKAFVRGSRCNGKPPASVDDFRALQLLAEVHEARGTLRVRWERLAAPAGLPAFDAMGTEPEPIVAQYAQQFPGLLEWWSSAWQRLTKTFEVLGFDWDSIRNQALARGSVSTPFARDAALLSNEVHHAVTHRRDATRRLVALRLLGELETTLRSHNGPRISEVLQAVVERNSDSYKSAYASYLALIGKEPTAVRRSAILEKIKPSAPAWAKAIGSRVSGHAGDSPPGDPGAAWRWRQIEQELNRRAKLDEVALNEQLHRGKSELRRITAELIDRRAWLGQIRRIDLEARQALQGWAQTQKRIGRGTGKRAPALQVEARKLLTKARDAVPVWIMPLARVAESFDPLNGRFDVVIVDEASQSDVTGLLAWYLGDRVAVVGDHEQVSPLAVGQDLNVVGNLIAQHLEGVPNAHLYDGQLSIYELARQSFGGTIALREHFRCVPDIIDFSNHLCYNGEIKPLRDPMRVPRPHVLEHVVPAAAVRDGKANEREARELVAIFKALVELPENAHRTFGAVTLLGDEQASLIQHLALQLLGAVELDKHRFAAGNAAQFQGDERDVMLLSMVDTSLGRPLPLRQTETFKQRYNVAVSRARDQLWLIHSLDPDRDLQPADLRRRLIEHVRAPEARRAEIQRLQGRAESLFEQHVIKDLVSAGFQVTPQVWVGRYRIDMVVSDANGQVAVECDGDRFHGPDEIPRDMERQAVLERAGWRFIRVRGTRYFRERQATSQWLLQQLRELGVTPSLDLSRQGSDSGREYRDGVVRRAWEIMRAEGWLEPEAASDDAEELESRE